MHMPSFELPEVLHTAIEEWFALVDMDRSGSLSPQEVLDAFKVRYSMGPNRPSKRI